jgi:hypothetical protein
MKRRIAFHEIPEMLSLMAWFQRQFVMVAETRRYLATMKALLHHNETAGHIDHFPDM